MISYDLGGFWKGQISTCDDCFLHSDIQMNITSNNDRVGIEFSLINIHGTPDNGILDLPFITLKGINGK